MNVQQMAETKSELQLAWKTQWEKNGRKGTLAGATGLGKTKPAIDVMMALWEMYKRSLADEENGMLTMFPITPPKILVVVPTEKLRDEGWPEEVKQWYGEEGMEMWKTCVKAVCYISLHKYQSEHYSLVVLDEVHWITPLSALWFKQNTYEAIMGLTATSPDKNRDQEKYDIIKQFCPVIFSYSLDQGVEDGVVADFEINVVMVPLDDKAKVIPAGSKTKPFLTTESAHYDYLCKSIKKLYMLRNTPGQNVATVDKRIMFETLRRTRFIYDLPSKTAMAKKLMDQMIGNKRTIVFCGSIKQSRILCGEEVFNSKDKSNGKFERFKAGEGSFLGVVNAANEGHNIKDLDQAIIVQVNSNERHLVQRIGRTVRAREGHKAVVWILCSQGTMDESWVGKSLANFDQSKIRYWSHKEFE